MKPVTLPVKRVSSANVNRPSSLSFSELKSNRFLSISSNSSRQVDLTLKPSLDANVSHERQQRRSSEASASQFILQLTPTKSKKLQSQARNNFPANCSSNSGALEDSFVILETPPRASTKQIPQNDLTGSVRRLFPQQQMKE